MAAEFAFVPQETNDTFQDVGFGPFVVQRQALLDEIMVSAKPKKSVHINGCKGAGKTTVLHQLGLILTSKKEEVYFFANARAFNRELVIQFVKALAKSKRKVYLLVDETQDNTGAELFTLLLKNNTGHAITTIGAGVRMCVVRVHRYRFVFLSVY